MIEQERMLSVSLSSLSLFYSLSPSYPLVLYFICITLFFFVSLSDSESFNLFSTVNWKRKNIIIFFFLSKNIIMYKDKREQKLLIRHCYITDNTQLPFGPAIEKHSDYCHIVISRRQRPIRKPRHAVLFLCVFLSLKVKGDSLLLLLNCHYYP